MGSFEEAEQIARQLATLDERIYGKDHPKTFIEGYERLATLQVQQGEYETALPMLHRVLAAFEQVLGKEHWRAGEVHDVMSAAFSGLGDLEGGLQHIDRALAIYAAAEGPDSSQSALALSSKAAIRRQQGERADALRLARQSLAILEKQGDASRNIIDAPLDVLGRLSLDGGRYPEALAYFERSRACVISGGVGPGSLLTSIPLTGIGEAEVGLGRWADAVKVLEDALARREGRPFRRLENARTRFALARALWGAGGDRARARTLAQQARRELEGSTGLAEPSSRTVDRWLAAHAQ
jgi:tetratricopeptide (TPR) repeat protein